MIAPGNPVLANEFDEIVGSDSDDRPRRREITLVRHGKSALGIAYGKARLDELQDLLDAYDLAGIDPASPPPQCVLDEVSSADLIVASPLTRTVESARRLADPGKMPELILDDLFREVELPQTPAKRLKFRLDPFVWVLLFRIAWLFRLYPGQVPSPRAVLRRAQAAADSLTRLSASNGHVVLVGHNMFNYLIGRALVSRSWNGKVRFQKHWDFQTFVGDV